MENKILNFFFPAVLLADNGPAFRKKRRNFGPRPFEKAAADGISSFFLQPPPFCGKKIPFRHR